MQNLTLKPIGEIRSPYKQRMAVPKQPAAQESSMLTSKIKLYSPYHGPDFCAELEGVSHIWVLFFFHSNKQSRPIAAKVRPPRAQGKRIGVWASRSPYRPNPIGMSCVPLLAVNHYKDHSILEVAGGDFLDGTPVIDLKPYIAYSDALPDTHCLWVDQNPIQKALIHFDGTLEDFCKKEEHRRLIATITHTLSEIAFDYESGKSYKCYIDSYDIHWQLNQNERGEIVCEVKTIIYSPYCQN